jgi:hypothetical protein
MDSTRETRSTKLNDMEGVTAALLKLQASFDKLDKKLDDTAKNINKTIDSKIEKLRVDVRTDLKGELLPIIQQNQQDIAVNASRINELESRVFQLENSMESNLKSSDLIMKGVPTVSKENVYNYYEKIAAVIGYTDTIPRADVFRLGRKLAGAKYDPPILIKFTNKLDKCDFHKKYFDNLNVKLSDIGFQSTARVFIGENLTKYNQGIFNEAMKMKKEGKVNSVSTSFGIVEVRVQEGSSKIKIDQLARLSNIVS